MKAKGAVGAYKGGILPRLRSGMAYVGVSQVKCVPGRDKHMRSNDSRTGIQRPTGALVRTVLRKHYLLLLWDLPKNPVEAHCKSRKSKRSFYIGIKVSLQKKTPHMGECAFLLPPEIQNVAPHFPPSENEPG